ncbi:hypothetical protein ABE65_020610 [Fictibacillus phosphorivorans]|uniref:DUF4352 domain-containing protein n=1 Tax=Fictibacillus phosphorivorans TaxID=1221500 RepID=A0A160IRF9_9BACL|nr:DUF4352 domain-containing protein [Fictibacillus phosphorivorans]ANC79073.1 hypothetical protein ABE65_020610 [Fictibacillus phosphorivorans]
MPLKGWIMLILSAALVTGCASESDKKKDTHENHQQHESNKAETENQTEKQTYTDSSQASDDTNLTEINKKVEDQDGSITLKKYAKVNKQLQSDSIALTIDEVKVLHYAPSVDLIDFFHGYTKQDEFPYVRVNVKISNNGKESVHFNPIAQIKTDQGETVTWKEDFYLEELNGEIKPGEEKMGSLGFILNKTNVENLKTITITSSEVVDDQKKSISDPLTLTVDL